MQDYVYQRRSRFALALVSGLIFVWISQPRLVRAQAAPEPAPAPEPGSEPPAIEPEKSQAQPEEMVVTGSRIRRKDLAGPAPVIVFSREQILASGRTNVGEFLQTIPEQSNAQSRGTNNGGEGSIRVNLRGLGVRLTLVLLNGRRLPPGGTGADDSADLSAIPSSVIERIEVLKDGASAIYGSDAVGGVINIITRKRFDGAAIDAYGSTSTRGDGQQVDVNGIIGASGKKGSVLVALNYYNGAPVWSGNRDSTSVSRSLDLSPAGAGKISRIGNTTIPQGNVQIPVSQRGVPNGNADYNQLARTYPTAGGFTLDKTTGAWRPFRGNNLPIDGGDGWNVAPYNYLVTPQERFNVFSSGEYNLGEHARLFFDSFYTKRHSAQTLAPEPLNLDFQGLSVAADNIYNPFGRELSSVVRRLTEFGRRSFVQDIHNFHLSAGIDGDLPESAGPFAGWTWEASFNYNLNEGTELKIGSLRSSRLSDALGSSFIDASGAPRCGTAGSPIEGCVPLNLFGGEGTITRDQIDWLRYTGVQRGYNEMIGAQANMSGSLFKLWAERALGLAFGYEFRALSGAQVPDPITVAGESTGNNVQITEAATT